MYYNKNCFGKEIRFRKQLNLEHKAFEFGFFDSTSLLRFSLLSRTKVNFRKVCNPKKFELEEFSDD